MSAVRIVQQITSKTTPVRIDEFRGIVQTVALSDGADTGFNVVINNKWIRSSNLVMLQPIYAGSTGIPVVSIVSRTRGSITVKVQNVGTAVLNAPLQIGFKIV